MHFIKQDQDVHADLKHSDVLPFGNMYPSPVDF